MVKLSWIARFQPSTEGAAVKKKDPAFAWGLDGVSQLLTKLIMDLYCKFKPTASANGQQSKALKLSAPLTLLAAPTRSSSEALSRGTRWIRSSSRYRFG
jgi:hypothetical protein